MCSVELGRSRFDRIFSVQARPSPLVLALVVFSQLGAFGELARDSAFAEALRRKDAIDS